MPRGGKREGAGRPAPHGRKVPLTIRVLPATKEMFDKMRESGFSIGDFIDESLPKLYEKMEGSE